MATRPIKQGVITSPYGGRVNPLPPHDHQFHPGLDIGVPGNPLNVPVYCAKVGKVAYINRDLSKGSQSGGGFGMVVYVKLPDGYYSVYPHLSLINYDLKIGDNVPEGTFIGIMGSTGMSTAVHLHYEERAGLGAGNSREPSDIISLYS